MGLFDFLKPKGQDRMQEMLQSIHKELFPGGQEQVEKEVQEVRALLDFKYTKDEIKNTYFHAAAIFYMDKFKQQDTIVTSILSNRESAVTRQDAIKIFDYLKKKFGITPLQSVASELIGGMTKQNSMFMLAKGGIVELKTAYKDISDKGKFEVILFNSSLILRTVREKTPNEYQKFQQDYVILLVSAANSYKIDMPVKDLMDLMNSRISLYVNETHHLIMTDNYKAYKVFNTIYHTPLIQTPSSQNPVSEAEYEQFRIALLRMVNWMLDKIKRIS